MNVAVAQTPKPTQQDLRYTLPPWMAAFVVFTLVPQLTMLPPAGRGFWYMPGLVLMGLVEGAFGGLVFVCLQRWRNPKDGRTTRIRNYLFAGIIVGVGSLLVMTAIYS
jgi:hypothetical protein